MSSIDHQRRDAVKLLEEIGYRWTGTEWKLPKASGLLPGHQLSVIDLADMMCNQLMRHVAAGDAATGEQDRSEWLIEAWNAETGFSPGIPISKGHDLMSRHKGMLSKHRIDRQWPHQVVIPNRRSVKEFPAIQAFLKERDHSPLGHGFVEDGEYQDVRCFAKKEDAKAFAERFDGKIIEPAKRPRWPGRRAKR